MAMLLSILGQTKNVVRQILLVHVFLTAFQFILSIFQNVGTAKLQFEKNGRACKIRN